VNSPSVFCRVLGSGFTDPRRRSRTGRSGLNASRSWTRKGKEADFFTAGDKVSVIINVRSNVKEDGLAVTLDFLDENNRSVFNTSSERLGYGVFAAAPGDSKFSVRYNPAPRGGQLLPQGGGQELPCRAEFRRPLSCGFHLRALDKGIKGTANLYPVFKEEAAPLQAGNQELRRT